MADNDQAPASAPDTGAQDVNDADSDFLDLGAAMVEELAATEESSTEESDKESPSEEADKPAEESKPQTEDKEGEAQADESKEKAEETDQPDKQDAATKRKEQLNTMIRELNQQKNQLKAEVAELNAQRYRVQSQEELVADGMDPEQARYEAENQRLQMEQYNAHLSDLNNSIDTDVAYIQRDFDWADPQSPAYNETLATKAYQMYMTAGQVQIDKNTGLVTQANVLPYQIYQTVNEIYATGSQTGKTAGAIEGQKAAEKMAATAEPQSSAPAPSDESDDNDPFLKGFNSV